MHHDKVIYFASAGPGKPIKVGCSKHVRTRLRQGLKLLVAIPGGRDAERAVHARYALFRIRGEWYRPAPELLRDIEAIKHSGAIDVRPIPPLVARPLVPSNFKAPSPRWTGRDLDAWHTKTKIGRGALSAILGIERTTLWRLSKKTGPVAPTIEFACRYIEDHLT